VFRLDQAARAIWDAISWHAFHAAAAGSPTTAAAVAAVEAAPPLAAQKKQHVAAAPAETAAAAPREADQWLHAQAESAMPMLPPKRRSPLRQQQPPQHEQAADLGRGQRHMSDATRVNLAVQGDKVLIELREQRPAQQIEVG